MFFAKTGVLLVEIAKSAATRRDSSTCSRLLRGRSLMTSFQSSEEAMSKLVDRTRTGHSDHFDEMRSARHWARCVSFVSTP